MFRTSIATFAAAAVLATASFSATTAAHAGKREAFFAGAVIAGAIIGAVAARDGHADEYQGRKSGRERNGWNRKRVNCDLVPVYLDTKYDRKIVGYDKVCD